MGELLIYNEVVFKEPLINNRCSEKVVEPILTLPEVINVFVWIFEVVKFEVVIWFKEVKFEVVKFEVIIWFKEVKFEVVKLDVIKFLEKVVSPEIVPPVILR